MKSALQLALPVLLLSPDLIARTENYCAAIRGNGEGMPAHWGAMSAVIQEKGLPSAMAGGSSASITIFLLESLALNPRVMTNAEKALLVKSFQGYFEAMTQSPEGKAIAAILADKEAFMALIASAKELGQIKVDPQNMALVQKHLKSLQTLANSPDFSGLINTEFEAYVKETAYLTDLLAQGKPGVTEAQVTFRKNQISKAINDFGKFDAQNDDLLFFRPGLVSFRQLGKVMGQMGDFYSANELKNSVIQKQVQTDLEQFLKLCTPGTQKLSWREINEQRPQCRQLLGKAVLTYRSSALKEGFKGTSRVMEKVGARFASFPATSVLTGSGVPLYKKVRAEYRSAEDSKFVASFKVAASDVRFGYWGKEEALKKIESSLKSNELTREDEKSKRFLSLGSSSWLEVMSASPAEPGLSSLVELSNGLISAGGWSDLHPTLLLRAHGCQDIVYVTRKGGESMFAQGVMKRLTDMEGFDFADWRNLNTDQRRQKNAEGDSRDVGAYASLWGRLYNMANPQSSIRKSMREADTIVCTDWDLFDSRKNLNGLVENSFRAQWISGRSGICR